MIDDIKDLSTVEKQKLIARKKFFACFGQCFVGIVVATFAMTLFSLFMVGDFLQAFTVASAAVTTGRFVGAFAMMLVLFFGVYSFSVRSGKGKPSRDFWLTCVMVVISYLLSVTGATKLCLRCPFRFPLSCYSSLSAGAPRPLQT